MSAIIDSGDGHVALAIVRSLGKKNIQTTVLSKKTHASSFYSKYCTNRVIKRPNLDYYHLLKRDDIVMPVNDDISLFLMKNRSKYSCIIPLPEYHILHKVINKNLLNEYSQEHGIPCPHSKLLKNADDAESFFRDFSFPIILKPIKSSGGKGITTIWSRDELKAVLPITIQMYGDVLLQEKIPFNQKYTVGCLCNNDSKVRRMVVLKEIRNYPIKTGPACCVETVRHPEIEYYSRKLLESLDFFGIANLDFVIDERDKKPKLLEINPRFWGSMQGAITAGVDFPYLLYTLANEGDIDKSNNYKIHIRCRKIFYEDILYLITTIKETPSLKGKIKIFNEFIQFYRDEGYYCFNLVDMNPFLISILCKAIHFPQLFSHIRSFSSID